MAPIDQVMAQTTKEMLDEDFWPVSEVDEASGNSARSHEGTSLSLSSRRHAESPKVLIDLVTSQFSCLLLITTLLPIT